MSPLMETWSFFQLGNIMFSSLALLSEQYKPLYQIKIPPNQLWNSNPVYSHYKLPSDKSPNKKITQLSQQPQMIFTAHINSKILHYISFLGGKFYKGHEDQYYTYQLSIHSGKLLVFKKTCEEKRPFLDDIWYMYTSVHSSLPLLSTLQVIQGGSAISAFARQSSGRGSNPPR